MGAQWFATANFILRQIPKTVKSLQVLLACPLGIQTIMNFFSPTKYSFFENKNTSTIDWIVTPTDLKIRQHQKRAHEEFFYAVAQLKSSQRSGILLTDGRTDLRPPRGIAVTFSNLK